MKKYLLYISFIGLAACGSSDQKAKVEEKPQVPLAQSQNSTKFNESFAKLLNDYYALKEAFIKEDTVLIASSAKSIKASADSLKLNEIKADSSIVSMAKQYALSISDEVKGVLGEAKLDDKRKGFQIITSDVFDLLRSTHYDREPVFMIHCPMAFNNQGADWLNNTNEIRNPYMPKKMLDCGEVKDSVDYRMKK